LDNVRQARNGVTRIDRQEEHWEQQRREDADREHRAATQGSDPEPANALAEHAEHANAFASVSNGHEHTRGMRR
ncbi:hypothetical protein ACW9HQ_50990, partial [Nocardia gipuzkoensis]